jgi:sulfatase modifying factor 1
MNLRVLGLLAVAAISGVASIALVVTAKAPGAQCGEGFFPVGHRCCPAVSGDGKACGPARTCPAPLVQDGGECVAPDVIVRVPATRIMVGPSDWEADGVVRARELDVAPFAIDAFEITENRIHQTLEDGARAAGGLSRADVVAFCAQRGGRLPSEEEWIVAASSSKGTRYPWGDTGAVCRRAAWGLVNGPCAHGARGPDTVGAHGGGDGSLGIHDLAGNVAEWVDGTRGVVLGGSYESQLATELRVWSRRVVDVDTHDPAIGGRCAYDIR